MTSEEYDRLRLAVEEEHAAKMDALLRERADRLRALRTVWELANGSPPPNRIPYGALTAWVEHAVETIGMETDRFTAADVYQKLNAAPELAARGVTAASVSTTLRRFAEQSEPVIVVMQPGAGRLPTYYALAPAVVARINREAEVARALRVVIDDLARRHQDVIALTPEDAHAAMSAVNPNLVCTVHEVEKAIWARVNQAQPDDDVVVQCRPDLSPSGSCRNFAVVNTALLRRTTTWEEETAPEKPRQHQAAPSNRTPRLPKAAKQEDTDNKKKAR